MPKAKTSDSFNIRKFRIIYHVVEELDEKTLVDAERELDMRSDDLDEYCEGAIDHLVTATLQKNDGYPLEDGPWRNIV